MKLTVNEVIVTPVLGSVTLEKHRGEAAYTLTATLWTAAADTYFQQLSLAVGDVVRLFDDGGTERFVGSIHRIDRTPERVVITAFDRGIYLARNALRGVFAGTGEEICRTVAARLAIDVDSVDADESYKTLIAATGKTAFSLLCAAAGEGRDVLVEGESLVVRRSSDDVLQLAAEQILEVSASVDIRDMVNRCTVVDYRGRVLADAVNAADFMKYGMFRAVRERTDKDAAAQAAAALKGRHTAATAVLLGDLKYSCGAKARGQQPKWGLDGLYRIDAVSHCWENGMFTTELTLEGVDA